MCWCRRRRIRTQNGPLLASGNKMSVYRTLDGRPHGALGVGSPKQGEDTQCKKESPQETQERERGFVKQRRLAPAKRAAPATFKWLQNCCQRPTTCPFSSHPRIANLMAGGWDDPKSFRPYLDDLLTDRRGNRKGFPREILRELLALRLDDENLHSPILDPYEKVGKRN